MTTNEAIGEKSDSRDLTMEDFIQATLAKSGKRSSPSDSIEEKETSSNGITPRSAPSVMESAAAKTIHFFLKYVIDGASLAPKLKKELDEQQSKFDELNESCVPIYVLKQRAAEEDHETLQELSDDDLIQEISDKSLKQLIATSDVILKIRLLSLLHLFFFVSSASFLLLHLLYTPSNEPSAILYNSVMFLTLAYSVNASLSLREITNRRKLQNLAQMTFSVALISGAISTCVCRVVFGTAYLFLVPFFAIFIESDGRNITWVTISFIACFLEVSANILIPKTPFALRLGEFAWNVSILVSIVSIFFALILTAVIKRSNYSHMKKVIIGIQDRNDMFQFQKEKAEFKTRKKSAFLATVSHEIRNPLHSILGMLSLVMKSDLDSEQVDYLETAYSSAQTLLLLLNDVLDVSKIEAGQMKLESYKFILPELVERTVKSFAVDAHRKGIELFCDVDRDIPIAVSSDFNRIRQVLINLLGNAIKFTNEGFILVTVKREICQHPNNKELIHIAVHDTGLGVPQSKVHAIFGKYQQGDQSTARVYGGTGLGLAICQRLASMLEGEIWCVSNHACSSLSDFASKCLSEKSFLLSNPEIAEPSTTFHFTFQCEKVESEELEGSSLRKLIQSPDCIAEFADKNVLCIASTAVSRLSFERMLKSIISKFIVISTSSEIIAALEREVDSPQYDAVILDDVFTDAVTCKSVKKLLNDNKLLTRKTIILCHTTTCSVDTNRSRELFLNVKRKWDCKRITKPIGVAQIFSALRELIAPSVQFDSVDATEVSVSSGNSMNDVMMETPYHVLVVDDNSVNLKLAEKIIEKSGHFAVTSTSGEQALELIKSNEHFDVILMDINMPGMSGYECSVKIREWEEETRSETKIPIVALTATAEIEKSKEFHNSGFDMFLLKPYKAKELVRCIKKAYFSNLAINEEDE